MIKFPISGSAIAILLFLCLGVNKTICAAQKEHTPENIKRLISDLYSTNNSKRESAIIDIVMIGEKVVPDIILSLGVPQKRNIEGVKEALIKIGAPSVKPLLAALNSDKNLLRQDALIIFSDMRDIRSTNICIELLKHEKDEKLVNIAVNALKKKISVFKYEGIAIRERLVTEKWRTNKLEYKQRLKQIIGDPTKKLRPAPSKLRPAPSFFMGPEGIGKD